MPYFPKHERSIAPATNPPAAASQPWVMGEQCRSAERTRREAVLELNAETGNEVLPAAPNEAASLELKGQQLCFHERSPKSKAAPRRGVVQDGTECCLMPSSYCGAVQDIDRSLLHLQILPSLFRYTEPLTGH